MLDGELIVDLMSITQMTVLGYVKLLCHTRQANELSVRERQEFRSRYFERDWLLQRDLLRAYQDIQNMKLGQISEVHEPLDQSMDLPQIVGYERKQHSQILPILDKVCNDDMVRRCNSTSIDRVLSPEEGILRNLHERCA